MLVGEVCNRDVVIVGADHSVQEATRLMRAHHVGDVVVVEERGGLRVPVGILTDRDVVVEVLAENVDLNSIAVGDVMSFELVTAREDDSILETMKLMHSKGVRRIPVVDNQGALIGILAVDDLLDLLAEMLSDLTGLILREQRREEKRRP